MPGCVACWSTPATAKPLDPSLPPTPVGVVPTTAKVGIDATIPEGVSRDAYERITYAYADTGKIDLAPRFRLQQR